MDELNRVIYEVKDLAEDAGDVAKTIAGDVVNRARELTEEGSNDRRAAGYRKSEVHCIQCLHKGNGGAEGV